jgi:hypothetical protein
LRVKAKKKQKCEPTFESVLAELGGELFSNSHHTDKYFEQRAEIRMLIRDDRFGPLYWKLRTRYEMGKIGAAEREFEALRLANIRQACHARPAK